MKLTVALVLLLCHSISSKNYKTKYFEVSVDHFSFTSNATFKLKYLINDTFWKDDGPIFFYTGNEASIENFADNTGFMFDIAPNFNALVIFAEHRYYGESLPFGNDSFTSLDKIGYLKSNQALADFVNLIDFLKNGRTIPVVAFGGSYGGMLAFWLRLKYPSSVIGAIASSAPIWGFQDLSPCNNFFKSLTQIFDSVEKNCSVFIRKTWTVLRNITASDEGKEWLSEAWKLCKPAVKLNMIYTWYSAIVANLGMFNYPYPTNTFVPLPAFPVKTFCSKLTSSSIVDDKSLILALGDALQVYTNFTKTTTCNEINIRSVIPEEKPWLFQVCTELIFPKCSTGDDIFENFDWNYKIFSSFCFNYTKVNQTNPRLAVLEYGGKDIKAASNVVFSNGLLDPWSSLGVLKNISSSVVSVVIPDAAHHLDLRAANKKDPKSVIEARQFHVDNIKKWLSEFYYENDLDYYNKVEFITNIMYKHNYN